MRRFMGLILILLVVAEAQAGVRQMSLRELCDGADRIVFGGVDKIESRWSGNLIVTDITIVPVENLKGAGTGPFAVTIPGGTVGTTTLHAGESPVFAVNEQVVVFLKFGNTPCGVYGWFRGKYTVVGDQIRELPSTSLAGFRQQILAEVNR
jgi:hypothetical protein